MHLLYLDESGTASDPAQHYFVLAGVAVNERAPHWIEQDLDKIAGRFNPADHRSIELHGSPMRQGRGDWANFPVNDRLQAMKDALACVTKQSGRARLFGAVIRKAALQGQDPVEKAFEQLSSRFDLYLTRMRTKYNDKQRGLILFDKASTERRIQTLAKDFKSLGNKWGKSRNYCEVPVFLDSHASRMIQLADLVAYALFRFYEKQDNTFYQIINRRFDSYGGVEHGLYIYL